MGEQRGMVYAMGGVAGQSFWEKQGALKGDWFREARRQCTGLRVGDSGLPTSEKRKIRVLLL